MPGSLSQKNISIEPRVRSKKRINKLIGKRSVGSESRSRINSNDFNTEDDWSSLTTLQTLKKRKRSRLNFLKSEDMSMMSA